MMLARPSSANITPDVIAAQTNSFHVNAVIAHSYDHYMNNCNLKWKLQTVLCIYFKNTSLISRVLLPMLTLQINPEYWIDQFNKSFAYIESLSMITMM